MKPSQACYDIIKKFEGCKLSAYKDPGPSGLPITIGWGSTYKRDGRRFELGDKITQAEADDLLQWEIDNKAGMIDLLLPKTVVSQNQFDALVSFAYNVGVGNLASSTLLKLVIRNPNNPDILSEFARWNKAGGKVLNGLIKRRHAEMKLYKGN